MVQTDDKTLDQLNEEADIAADYLEGLLDIADYEGDIEMGVRNGRPMVQIVADDDTDIKHLIGKNGEVVDALQQLTRLAVQQATGERSHLIERKIIHDVVRDEGLRSRSHGEEPHRYVTVYLKRAEADGEAVEEDEFLVDD